MVFGTAWFLLAVLGLFVCVCGMGVEGRSAFWGKVLSGGRGIGC